MSSASQHRPNTQQRQSRVRRLRLLLTVSIVLLLAGLLLASLFSWRTTVPDQGATAAADPLTRGSTLYHRSCDRLLHRRLWYRAGFSLLPPAPARQAINLAEMIEASRPN
jgi:hypothetical protein